eukprot:snap_masked-scaffold_5-processed-gene-6.19-mRNA-1 protein AED:1.00 eAED:1.00 QI:0/0/0/0/1/1/2/0/75
MAKCSWVRNEKGKKNQSFLGECKEVNAQLLLISSPNDMKKDNSVLRLCISYWIEDGRILPGSISHWLLASDAMDE